MAALLVTVSLASRKMSQEEFGLWSILLAFMFLAGSFDLGFRYGLANRMAALVARAGGRQAPDQHSIFLCIFAVEAAIALAGAAVCLCLFPHLPWAALFSTRHPALVAEMPYIMPVVGALLFLYLPFSLWGSALYAYQEITLVSVLSGAQSLILLGAFAVAVFTVSFQNVLVVYFSAYVLTGVAITAFLFMHRSWAVKWVPWRELKQQVSSISRPSLDFFILSISAALTATVGTFFSGAVTGLEKAGDFSLVQKIFSLLVTLHLAFLSPLAPAYTRHAHLGDWGWVRQQLLSTLRRTWPLIFAGGGLLLVVFHPLVIRVWAGKWLSDFTLAGLLALWALAMGWINTYSVLLNSLGLVRFQGVFCLVMVVPVLVLPLVLGLLWGITGVALASLLCTLPAAVLWPIYTSRALREKKLLV